MDNPLLILISGKRFSGKNYLESIITEQFNTVDIKLESLHSSNILKKEFCEKFNYNYDKILTDRSYKESLRDKMNKYYNETKKTKSIDYYNKKLIEHIKTNSNTKVFILHVRHKFEISFFEKYNFRIIKIRIEADNKVKMERGWIYNINIDKDITEIDLDDYDNWDYIFNNNDNNNKEINKFAQKIINHHQLIYF
jgi:phosphomevalonate kinase